MGKKVRLHYETISTQLKEVLLSIMATPAFESFYLVGGTSISLRLGHRKSADIDLFTKSPYGSLDFSVFDQFFLKNFKYCDPMNTIGIVGMGKAYYVGESQENCIKIDLYYHEEFDDPCDVIDGIRIASLADVTAMKVDVISRIGRKKDFWDLHELLNTYSIADMLELHNQRFGYTHDRKLLITNFSNFSSADEDFDPICLTNKVWEIIKLDFTELAEQLK